jgi:hypothetical protein
MPPAARPVLWNALPSETGTGSCISWFIFRWAPTGDRLTNLNTAIERLRASAKWQRLVFLRNRAGRIRRPALVSELRGQAGHRKMPKQLLSEFWPLKKRWEESGGRKRPRSIDIDILLFGNSIIDAKV